MALTKISNMMLVQPVNHNILINPSFTVNQRGNVIDHNVASYGPDRWGVSGISSTGGTRSESTTAIDPTTGINKLVIKHRNATGSAHTYQRVEAVNLLGLYGKEMTLSFSFSNIGTPNLPNVRIYTWNAAGDYSIIHEAVPTSLGNSRWACTFTLSTDDGTIPKATDVGLGVTIYSNENKTDPAPNEWSVWETKLESGSVVTPFIARPYGEEFMLCGRYFQRYGSGTGSPLVAVRRGTNLIGFNIPFSTRMRTKPTISNSDPSKTKTWTVRGGGNSETWNDLPDVTTQSDYFVTLSKAGLTFDPSSTAAFVVYSNAASSGGYLYMDSEL